MSSLLILIPLSILLVAVAIGAFFWAVRKGQFDDLDTPAWRVVLDDDRAPPESRDDPAERKEGKGRDDV